MTTVGHCRLGTPINAVELGPPHKSELQTVFRWTLLCRMPIGSTWSVSHGPLANLRQ